MRVLAFNVDKKSLVRSRNLRIAEGNGDLAIPETSVYAPLTSFIKRNKGSYPFKMIRLLHVAGQTMLAGRIHRSDWKRALFAAGGLYLALDQGHRSLAFDRSFGDFTAGFSHQFGVALACLSLSEAFSVPWHSMTPIPVKGKKALDYEVPLSTGQWLKFEAKGVSTEYRSQARRSIADKKQQARKLSDASDTAMIGVVTQAARGSTEDGVVEFIDPLFESSPEARREENQLAGRLLHYAGLAAFAGLIPESEAIKARALRLVDVVRYPVDISIPDRRGEIFRVRGRRIAGIQWRIGDYPTQDVWFLQGVDYEIIRGLLDSDTFPNVGHFSVAEDSEHSFVASEYDGVQSIMMDGSFFGISSGRVTGLSALDRRDDTI